MLKTRDEVWSEAINAGNESAKARGMMLWDATSVVAMMEEFDRLSTFLHAIDLTKVKENDDNTNLTDQQACAGGACEVK